MLKLYGNLLKQRGYLIARQLTLARELNHTQYEKKINKETNFLNKNLFIQIQNEIRDKEITISKIITNNYK